MSFLTSDFNLLEEAETNYVDVEGLDLTEATQINLEMEVAFANLRESTILAEYQMEMQAIKESAGLQLTESAREVLTEKAEESSDGFFKKAWAAIQAAWEKMKSFFAGLWTRIVALVMGDKKWLADEKVSGALKGFKGTVSAKVFGNVAKSNDNAIKQVINALPSLANLEVGKDGFIKKVGKVVGSAAGMDLKQGYNAKMMKIVKEVTGKDKKDVKGSISTAMQTYFLGSDEAEQECKVSAIYNSAVSVIIPAASKLSNLNKLIMAGSNSTLAATKLAADAANKDGEAKKQANAVIAEAKAATALTSQVLAGATSVIAKYRSQSMGVLRKAYGSAPKATKESVEFGFSLFDAE